jgi:RES domain-containing protein
MALTAWRLIKEKHAKDAFDGEGAGRFGGRWNARGTPVVYLSSSLSLAALELFVHLTAEDARIRLSAIPVSIPNDLAIQELPINDLPEEWRSEPPPDACKVIGSEWAEANETALLKVPSVIVPHEFNYALNPRHPDFSRLNIHKAEPFGFDSRMWK